MEYGLLNIINAYPLNANLRYSVSRCISPHNDSTGQLAVSFFCPVQYFSDQNRYSQVTDKQTSVHYGRHLSIQKQGKD